MTPIEGEGLGEGSGGELADGLTVEGEFGDGVGAEVDHPQVSAIEGQVPGGVADGEGFDGVGRGRVMGGAGGEEAEAEDGHQREEGDMEETFHGICDG